MAPLATAAPIVRAGPTPSEPLVDAIEALLDRKVLALLSDNHLALDVAVEVFVLEPED